MSQKDTPPAGAELPATAPDTPSAQAHIDRVRESEPVVLFDREDPRALMNLLPKQVVKAVEDALFDDKNKELFGMDELTLYKYIKQDETMSITPTDNRLRLKFWMEYDYCQAFHTKGIDWKRVIAGICTYENFFRNFLKKPHKVAWLLCPPTGYAVKVNESLEFGIDQLRDILEIPHTVGGKTDHKLGELKSKIVALLHVWQKGAPVQRAIVANLTGNAAAQAAGYKGTEKSMEAMERKLKELEKKEKELMNGGNRTPVIDVEEAF